ncbi:MAG: hypothetical protein QOI27_531 [Gaiellaceae bacterium]|nr:hypothetical protein [Gaiellaceae bacterium]
MAIAVSAIVLVLAPGPLAASPGAVVRDATGFGCQTSDMPRNDDGSTASVALPFTINFFGVPRSSVYINNNGNLTFTDPLGTFTPFKIVSTGTAMIAPFFADVDTRNLDSGVVHYGTTTFDGRQAFCVTWDGVAGGVGYFNGKADKLNTFQVLLVDRSTPTTPGDFDIVFNYDNIQWETGDLSGGTGGLGGSSARIGYTNGTNQSYELPGSGIPGSFLDPNGLIAGSNNSGGQLGRYVYTVRNGITEIPPPPDPGNDVWPRASVLDTSSGSATTTAYIGEPGKARWYVFDAPPNSQFTVDTTDQPANYDLAVFRDIGAAYTQLTTPSDLLNLTASNDVVAPSQFAPSQFAPSQFAPSQFAPSQFAPSQFAPSQFAPSQFAPAAPGPFSPDAYTSAQVASIIGLSAHDGTADESVTLNTWNDTRFYVRVTGRNGEFDAHTPFTVSVNVDGSVCNGVAPIGGAPGAQGGGFKTVILTDPARMEGSDADKATLRSKLDALAAATGGVVVDLGQDPRVAGLNSVADTSHACPYAKNLVAGAIKDIVDSYRNPQLKYVVVVGNDHVIPFFRYPDQAGLGPESGYSPPVADSSASQAALRLDYVLGQDAYGSKTQLSVNALSLPIPDLAVGRLVETPTEISGMIDAYLGTNGGVVPTPHSSLVTGYDFLTDAATAIEGDLSAGLGGGATNDTLISNQGVDPANVGAPPTHSWTAAQLRTQLLGTRHDLIFLGGHFSANNTLAADFSTTLNASELDSSTVDLKNSIVFSAGCHVGYNIANGDAIPNVTATEDWAQAFARKQATLIGGTGYQYGDSDFLEYSERLYADFAHELRVGTGAVPIGVALARAKQDYLDGTPSLRGMHVKALLEATLFGLPMLSVDLPGRVGDASDTSVVTSRTTFADNPGSTLGLSRSDLTLTPAATQHTKSLVNVGGGTVSASWLSGPDGLVTNPGEPALPLASPNVSVPGQVLRGVGFRGGQYTDTTGVTPLTGAPATDSPGIHTAFTPETFFPRRLWTVNYFDALANGTATGATRLMVTPAQYRGDGGGAQTSTLRAFSSLSLRLYYSSNISTYGANIPAHAAPPSIAQISSTTDPTAHTVTFSADVVGDPAAGVQEVWVTYRGLHPSLWESLDLVQSVGDSRVWSATLPLGDVSPTALRYVVQAVNGVGLVTLDDNLGAYYTPGAEPGTQTGTPAATHLSLGAPSTGTYGATVSLSATLSGGTDVSGKTVMFSVGGLGRSATTDASGNASVSLPLLLVPRTYRVTAGFGGDADNASSSAASSLEITKAPAALSLSPPSTTLPLHSDAGNDVTAALSSGGGPLRDQSVLFVVLRSDGTLAGTASRTTDYLGRAGLEPIDLPPGAVYTVNAYFGGIVPAPAGPLTLGNAFYDAAVSSASTVTVIAPSTLSLSPAATIIPRNSAAGTDVTATLRSGGAPLAGASVLFVVRRPDGSVAQSVTRQTDALGHANLEPIDIAPAAGYTVAAYFGGSVPLPSGTVVLDSGLYDPSTASGTTVAVYAFSGFYAPVNNVPTLNVAKAGSAVPVKFTLGFNAGLSILATGYPKMQAVSCSSSAPLDAIETTVTANSSGLQYDASSGQYNYVWKTPSSASGCQQLTLLLADGTKQVALFKFK